MDPYATSHISNAALRHEVRTGAANDCRSTAVLLSRLGEFDARRLYLEEAYPSMYSYCLQELHFCEGTASRRIYAARAARRFPILFDAVADGRLHLTAVVMLRKYLTSANVDELVAATTHKSKAGVELLIAQRFPRRDMPERLDAVSANSAWTGLLPHAHHSPENAHAGYTLPTEWPTEHSPENVDPATRTPLSTEHARMEVPAHAAGEDPRQANTAIPAPRAKVTPLAPERFGLQVALDQETHDLLQQARALMSHQNPGGEIAPVLKRALRLPVAQLEQRKFAVTARPRNASQRTAKSNDNGTAGPRHIPSDVKRAVRERDEGRCTFVSESGKRCGSRALLELDHVEPVARGGASTVGNVRLRCRSHNQYTAEHEFGSEFMDRKRGRRPARRQNGLTPVKLNSGTRRAGATTQFQV